ncbi:acetyl-CoA C-acetyltransferase [Pseudarthrobacter sp. H2]|uniref:acetyl-CoA C-acetyltransferase n=1 Tax=Pseudarthrobacter sp. H2 TaxID=3418415 RepID=UPI003CF498DB
MTPKDNDAVIVAIGRSPIGRAGKGTLTAIRPDDLAAEVFTGILAKVPDLPLSEFEDLHLGCAQPQDEHGWNMARRVAVQLGADLLPGTTVNRYCASSLQGARMAFHAIRAGEGRGYLVGGVECVSWYGENREAANPGFAEASARTARIVSTGAAWSDPRLEGLLPDYYMSMGHTAENVAALTGTTRSEMDAFAARSQQRAVASAANGFFAREIIPVTGPDGQVFSADDGPRPGTTAEKLAGLKPVFREDGTVTAGNACPLNDGAAGSVIVSAELARDYGLKPLARIVSTGVTGLSPEIMGLGPVEASRMALRRAGLGIKDIGIVELNEAFAAQVLPSARQLGIDIDEQLNPHGGSIALGHPFGATGVRLLTTLINGLDTRDQQFGLATMCVGGGQGMAMVIERLS